MSTHGHNLVNYQRQTKGRDLISHRCLPDTNSKLINAKPIVAISYQCLHGHKHLIDNTKPMGVISFQCLHRHKHYKSSDVKPMGMNSYQCLNGHKHAAINAKLVGTILNLFIKTGNDYSLAINSTESLYQLVYLRFICYKLKLIDVITIPMSLCYIIIAN